MIVPKNGAPKLTTEVCARTRGARNTAAIGRMPMHASTCSQARFEECGDQAGGEENQEHKMQAAPSQAALDLKRTIITERVQKW